MDDTEFKIADALIEAQEKRIAELEAALAPFARAGTKWSIVDVIMGSGITVGEWREAARALGLEIDSKPPTSGALLQNG